MGVSVIIPTYNKYKLLGKAIESAIAQTYKDVEIIISDDGSTDETQKIVEKYRDHIVYIKHKHAGQSYSRNIAIDRATFDIIAFLDHDDIWESAYLEQTIEALKSNKQCIGVSTNRFDVYRDGKMSLKYKNNKPKNGIINLKWMIKEGPVLAPSTTVVHKKYLIKAGGFRTVFDGSEDWDLWLRMLKFGYFLYIDKPLVYKKETGYNLSMPVDVWEKDVLIIEDFVNRLSEREKEEFKEEIQYISTKLYNRYAKVLLHTGFSRQSRKYFKKSISINKNQPKTIFRYYLTFAPSILAKVFDGMYLRNIKQYYKNKRGMKK